VKGISPLGIRGGVRVNGYVRAHIDSVILGSVIILQIYIAVLKETVSNNQVMRFVSGKDHAPGDKGK
jgi:hypothetical protein